MSQPPISSAPILGFVLFPGSGAEWEVWEKTGTEGAKRCSEGLKKLQPGIPIAAAGLPVGSVLNFVFRAPPADLQTLRSLASIQLEQQITTLGKGKLPTFDVVPSGQTEAKTSQVVLVEALEAPLPPELERPEISRFETSARLLPLPSEGCALWVEKGRLVLGVTRGGALLYFQSLSESRWTSSVFDELYALGRILKMEGLMSMEPMICVWTDMNPKEQERLLAVLGGKIKVSPRPSPRLPSRVGGLAPPSVVLARSQRELRAKFRWLAMTGIALYFLFIGGWIAVLSWHTIQNKRLEKDLDQSRQEVSRLQSASQAWGRMQSAVDPSNFPLMLLWTLRKAMPSQDLWITEFRISEGFVELRGATTVVDLVYQFQQNLKSGGGGIDWNFDIPTIRSADLTQFRVHGKLPYATVE